MGGDVVRRRIRFRRPGWLQTVVFVVLAGLMVNAWVQAGTKAMVVVVLAAVGCAVTVLGSAYTTGTLVVRHAQDPRRQVESSRARIQIEGPR